MDKNTRDDRVPVAALFAKSKIPNGINVYSRSRLVKQYTSVPIAVTNYLEEKSFSYLKRAEIYLRFTISEDQFNSLVLLCIESELMSTIDFLNTIDTFVNLKSKHFAYTLLVKKIGIQMKGRQIA